MRNFEVGEKAVAEALPNRRIVIMLGQGPWLGSPGPGRSLEKEGDYGSRRTVVRSVPRFIRLRTAPSVIPRAAAAWATVRRSWFASGSAVWPSPTRGMLDH